MTELDGPVLVLTGEDAWRLVHGRGHRDVAGAVERLAARWAADAGWRSDLEPVAKVAAELGVSVDALRHRLRRGSWPGELVARRWWAVPPSSPAAPSSRP